MTSHLIYVVIHLLASKDRHEISYEHAIAFCVSSVDLMIVV